jgi:hypothetical protein
MRTLLVLAAAIAALLLSTASASAGIWTPQASGTTQEITAIDYRAVNDIYVATANGQILRNGTVQLNAPGVTFTGIELNPSGTAGLATATLGKLYRYNGTTWSLVNLANTTRNHSCPGSGFFLQTATPTGNLTGVSWKDDTTAYVAGADRGVLLKTTNGGTGWFDVSRRSDGTCFADPGFGAILSDVATVKGTDTVYVLTDSFAARRISSDGFASPAAERNTTAVNCFDVAMKIAVDQDSPNRSVAVGKCAGSLSNGFSSDGGTSYELGFDYANGSGSNITTLYDVAIGGGSAIAVGDGGTILLSPDGLKGYFQPADGAEATTGWRAVDKFDLNNAAVGGVGGKLVVSTQANTIPDLVAPSGTISGPVTATAGQAVTYTANVADNAGGSGINPASFAWNATGIPAATGNPVSITFPSAGFYTLRVGFKDLAGNAAEATLSVNVSAAAPAPSGSTTVTRTVSVPGGSIQLRAPRACVPAGGSFSATLSFRKSRKKGTKKVKVTKVEFYIDRRRVKTDTKAPFRQTLTVRNLAAGSRHTLRARATIKVRRGKSPKKSVSTTFSVCA